jgi:hypothetical protein
MLSYDKKHKKSYPILQCVKKDYKKDYKKYNPKIIYYTSNKFTQEINDDISEIKINKDEELYLLPYNRFGKPERIVSFVSGQSGSGKSYNISKMVYNLHNYYNDILKIKKRIFIFSVKTDDPAFMKIKKHTTYIELSEEILNFDITTTTLFDNSICIFDDTDTISSKSKLLDKKIREIQHHLLEVHRSHNTDVFLVSHISNNFRSTLVIWNELTIKIIFQHTLRGNTFKRIMDKLGFDKKEIENIRKSKDYINSDFLKIVPKINLLFSEKTAKILN